MSVCGQAPGYRPPAKEQAGRKGSICGETAFDRKVANL